MCLTPTFMNNFQNTEKKKEKKRKKKVWETISPLRFFFYKKNLQKVNYFFFCFFVMISFKIEMRE